MKERVCDLTALDLLDLGAGDLHRQVVLLPGDGTGKIDVGPWLGANIGLTGVEDALHAMSSPSSPVRTVVDPRRM